MQCALCVSFPFLILPLQVICAGGENVTSQQGYYLAKLTNVLALDTCPNPEACLESGVTGTQCVTGYRGRACTLCDSNWFSPETSPLICESCPNTGFSVAIAIVVPAVVYAMAIYSAQLDYDNKNEYVLPSLLKMLIVHGTVYACCNCVSNMSYAFTDFTNNQRCRLELEASGPGCSALSCICFGECDGI